MRSLLAISLVFVASLARGQTISPSSIVMGLGGIITVTGDYSTDVVARMDGHWLPRTALTAGVSAKFRVENRRFWHGPKRVTIADIGSGAILDDTAPSGVAIVGSWGTGTYYHKSYGGSYRTMGVGSGTNTITYTFSGLTPGDFDVWTTWRDASTRATDAEHQIKDGATPLVTVDVDQTVPPNDSVYAGLNWEQLGPVTITGTSLVVVVTDNTATGSVNADAIRINPVGSQPSDIVIDDQFKLTEYRTPGTEIIMYDFEDNETPTDLLANGTKYYQGNSLSSWFNTGKVEALDGIANDPTHGSNYSFRFIIAQGNQSGGADQSLIFVQARTAGYTGPDGLNRNGLGFFIPEATGMNRWVYDVKLPTLHTSVIAHGTYHAKAQTYSSMPAEDNGWHYYEQSLGVTKNTWIKMWHPFAFSVQRSKTGVTDPGIAVNWPVEDARMDGGTGLHVWDRQDYFNKSPFDDLTRYYFDISEKAVGGPSIGEELWLDNIGFASVDQELEMTPQWINSDKLNSVETHFPFSITNKADHARTWYISGTIASNTDGNPWLDVSSPYGLYLDVNQNGTLELGTDTYIVARADTHTEMPAFSAGETRHYLWRYVNVSAAVWRNAFISITEKADPADAGLAAMRAVGAVGESGYPSNNPLRLQETTYDGVSFSNNRWDTLPSNTTTVPANIVAVEVGGDTRILWDDPEETSKGTCGYYELQRSDDGVSFSHYRCITAASPGYIDEGVTGKYYRARMVNTQGTKSAFSSAVQAGIPASGIKSRVRRRVRFGFR